MGLFRMMAVPLVVIITLSLSGKWVAAQVHHVVGGDRGWDPSSDIISWASGRIFSAGDKIWFTYSAAQGAIAELKSKEEYESCDVSNPIRMFTDGLDGIALEGKGIRYFVSSNSENCKSGLKLHVEILPKQKTEIARTSALVAAEGPSSSASSHKCGSLELILSGLACLILPLIY